MFAGHLLDQPDSDMWDLTPPDAAFEAERHGFAWLDDLAAVGDAPARARAARWTWQWIDRYSAGRGPGWTPQLTGRRLIRLITHAQMLQGGQDRAACDTLVQTLGQQALFLRDRWQAAAPGLPRIEALTGLVLAGLALDGMQEQATAAVSALGREADTLIGTQGALESRNPEELLDIFALLTWTTAAQADMGQTPPAQLAAAVARIAPTLRLLRHADGALARFHGGGAGMEGRLDTALAASGSKARHAGGSAMGYARLSAGRTSIVIDAAPPPGGTGAAHASTLAFELTSGRRPLIVNCGPGASFGADWRRAGRATPSHSALVIAGASSALLGTGAEAGWLARGPVDVPVRLSQASDGQRFEGGHDGYVSRFGLTHARTIEMVSGGRGVAGEDMLLALSQADKRRFDDTRAGAWPAGLPYQIHFHLHPDVDAVPDMDAVSLELRSGEVWVFRTGGAVEMTLEPSVYLENARPKPRACKQIVLTATALRYASRIRWSLAKTQDTPISIRDLAQDAPDPDPDSV